MSEELKQLAKTVHSCQLCVDLLPQGPRPILQVDRRARILIAGQAPGARVNVSGIPFDDANGNRLRNWMGIDRKTFYDPTKIAILSMG